MPSFKGQLTDQQIADVAAYVVKATGGNAERLIELPPTTSRATSRVVATDLDRTLDRGGRACSGRARCAALARRAPPGMHVIVVTGRMFQSVRPYARAGGARRSGRLLPGRRRRRPGDGRVAPPRADPARARARGDRRRRRGRASTSTCYVDDELYVAEVTPEARAYADFQHLEIHAVGDLLRLARRRRRRSSSPSATRPRSTRSRRELKPRFGGRLYISKSLPYFLEFAHPDVTQGLRARLRRRAARLHAPSETVAFGDGENDVELLEWAGYGVAVANAHERVQGGRRLVVPAVRARKASRRCSRRYLDSQRMIDLSAARARPGRVPRRARAQGRGRGVRRAARRRRALARARSRGSTSCARSTKLEGQADARAARGARAA